MASEYLKWLARDEIPTQKRELTTAQKMQNWWYYHKWHLAVLLAGAILLGSLISDIFWGRSQKPDYQIAYIGEEYLPEETSTKLKEIILSLGEDVNADGTIQVQLAQYIWTAESVGESALTMDLALGNSVIFLMENPELIQEKFGILSYGDGKLPQNGEILKEPLWYPCDELPRLQELTGFSIGRRNYIQNEAGCAEAYVTILQQLTKTDGAVQ